MRRSKPIDVFRWLFDGHRGPRGQMVPRWIFLRALALIYFSAFYSLLFQIKGFIGPDGILPAQDYLDDIAQQLGLERYWYAPSLYWFSSSSTMMMAVTWIGLIASVIAFINLWPPLELFRLLCLFPFVRRREQCVLELSVGRNAAGGRISGSVLRAARALAGLGRAAIRPRA